jgi:hypothetical protein
MKVCAHCRETKPLDQFCSWFSKRGKLCYYSYCCVCATDKSTRYGRSHKEEKREYDKAYVALNKARKKQQASEWYQANKDSVKARSKKRYETNKVEIHNAGKKRYHDDLDYKLKLNLRRRLNSALKGNFKTGSAVESLGCSIDELKIHLQKSFYARSTGEQMAWGNYGRSGWHIDHILPLDSFNLKDPEQIKEACHYTNLQPLWAEDNLSKGNKIEVNRQTT